MKKRAKRTLLIAVLVVLGVIIAGGGYLYYESKHFVERAGWDVYEQNPVFQPFVSRLFVVEQPYYRMEFSAVDEPFDLELSNLTIPVQAGRRVVYAMNADGPAAFKLHAEIAQNDFDTFKSGYVRALTFPDTDVKEWEYKSHGLRLLKEKYAPGAEYQGAIAVGNVFFPEKKIVATIYFFDTPFYGKPLPAMEQIMEKLVDNVETGYYN